MFWNRLEKALKENNITSAELSRKIGVAPSVINSWKIRDSIPRADIACKTAKALNTSVEYLVNGNVDVTNIHEKAKTFLIPILNQELSAGRGQQLPDNDEKQGLVAIPAKLRRTYGDNLAALHVHGDSMQPTLNDGDMIVCDSLGWDKSDGIYAIRMNGNVYVKRIQVANGKILIKSDNPNYETIEEPLESDAISIIGKVRLIIHPI